jgi:hypothetical protein
VRGDICSVCCGEEREISIACPLDCEYLRESRRHDKPRVVDPAALPNRDIQVTEALLSDNREMLTFLALTIFHTAMETSELVDRDVNEALDSLIRTYRTLQSGVYYETRPANPLAAAIFGAVQEGLAEWRRREHEALGFTKTRDADCLGVLVFLQHLAIDRNNGRQRGRAFLETLLEFYPEEPEASPRSASSIILP